jgi:hypothetical protein
MNFWRSLLDVPGKGDNMKTSMRFTLGFFLFVFPMLIFSGSGYADSSLAPWVGVWTLAAEKTPDIAKMPSSQSTVEILPTSDGKGIQISRKTSNQSTVKEVLILDGSKQPLDANNCSGWQISKWIPEPEVIIGSSEISCKDSGSFRTSNMKLMLSADQMVDILGVKVGNQTRVATRRLHFDLDLQSAKESRPEISGIAARTAASAPWNLPDILQLSKSIDDQVLQAALVEKKARLTIDANSLKQMRSAKLSKETIDLLIALAFPNEFMVQTNGEVKLQPISRSASSSSGVSYLPVSSYYPSSYAYLSNLWFYYGSPFWWDDYFLFYPRRYSGVVITGGGAPSGGSPSGGSSTSSHGQMTNQGYVQITPIDSGRHAVPPNSGNIPYGSRSGVYLGTAPPNTGSSGSYSPAPASSGSSSSAPASSGSPSSPSPSSGGSGSSGGSSAPPPSSGGDDSGRHAVPR